MDVSAAAASITTTPAIRFTAISSFSEGAGIAAAVDQDALPGNVTGLGRAKICTKRAEFGGIAITLCRAGGGALGKNLLEGLAAAGQQAADVAVLGVAVENSRQHVVDGDATGGGLPRQARSEVDQSGACAVRQPELGLRHLHAARDD